MYLYLFIAAVLAVAGFLAWRAAREGRLDLRGVVRRASTWLGLLSVAQGGAVLGYNQAPASFQSALPDYLGGYLLVGMMLCGALTGLATSIQQKWLPAPDAKQ